MQYREWERSPGVGRRALGCLAVIILTAIIIIAGIATYSSVLRPQLEARITAGIDASRAALVGGLPGEVSIPDAPVDVPTIPVPSAGARQIIITEAELNQRIEANREQIKPLDSLRVAITPEAFVLQLRAFGIGGEYRGKVVAQDGQLLLTHGKVSGPLGWMLPTDPLESALNDQLRASLSSSGVIVEAVTMEQGQMTVTVASQSE